MTSPGDPQHHAAVAGNGAAVSHQIQVVKTQGLIIFLPAGLQTSLTINALRWQLGAAQLPAKLGKVGF